MGALLTFHIQNFILFYITFVRPSRCKNARVISIKQFA